MALTSEDFKARCLAAAALHGTGMRGLRDILGEFGTEKTLAEAIIRGEKDQNRRNIRDLAEAVELPRAWFTEPDWRDLIPGSGRAAREAVDPDAEEQDADLEDAAQQSESTDLPSGEQEPGVQNE